MSVHLKIDLFILNSFLGEIVQAVLFDLLKKFKGLASYSQIPYLVSISSLPVALGLCQGSAVCCQLLSKECSLLLYLHFTSLRFLGPSGILEQPSI